MSNPTTRNIEAYFGNTYGLVYVFENSAGGAFDIASNFTTLSLKIFTKNNEASPLVELDLDSGFTITDTNRLVGEITAAQNETLFGSPIKYYQMTVTYNGDTETILKGIYVVNRAQSGSANDTALTLTVSLAPFEVAVSVADNAFLALDAKNQAVELASQLEPTRAGKGYATRALMNADTTQVDGTTGIVYNDTAINNGYYFWDNVGNVWTKRAEFYATVLDPDDSSEAVTGKAVGDYIEPTVNFSSANNLVGDGFLSSYNGIDSKTILNNNYVLENIGDSVEFQYKLKNVASLKSLGIMGEVGIGTSTIGFASLSLFYIRASNGNYITTTINPRELLDGKVRTIKLVWVDGDIQFYKNGQLITTAGATGSVTINNIGNSYDFAEIEIGKIKINSSGVETVFNTPLFVEEAKHTNVDLVINEGFLSEQQRTDFNNAIQTTENVSQFSKKSKNLIDSSEIVSGQANGTASSNWRSTGNIPVLPNTQYTLSGFGNLSPTANGVVFYRENGTSSGATLRGSDPLKLTFTTPANVSYLRANVVNEVGAGSLEHHPNDDAIMLELGDTRTAYEPFRTSYVFEGKSINYPDCFYSLDINGSSTGNELFIIYTHISDGYYVGNELHHELDLTEPSPYVDIYRIRKADIYKLENNTMTSIGLTALELGDSESVYRLSGASDFSCGVHGDEIRISTLFYVDGVALTDISSDIPLSPCDTFKVVQKSNTYDPDSNPKVIDTQRFKILDFLKGGWDLRNRFTWQRTPSVSVLWYSGMGCQSKDLATKGYIDVIYEVQEFTGTGLFYFEQDNAKEFYSNNEINKLSSFITSEVLIPTSINENADVFIWDRVADSKYYRRHTNLTPVNGEVWKAEQKIRFYKSLYKNINNYS